MANQTKTVLSVIATTSKRVKDLPIQDGQLVFIQDIKRVAFDFKGQRTFYNQITELETNQERLDLEAPEYGYYYVIQTNELWRYDNTWIQITSNAQNNVLFDSQLSDTGEEHKLYVNTVNRNISVWDSNANTFVVVGDSLDEASNADINALFA